MPPWAPTAMQYEAGFESGASSGGVPVVANTTINTKGSWAEIIASTAVDAIGFWLTLYQGATFVSAEYLLDIGIGAASSEQVIVADIPYCHGTASGEGAEVGVFIPLAIPAGTRIAARCQGNVTGSGVIDASIVLVEATFMGQGDACHISETVGAVASDSGGTACDPGGTANTKNTPVVLSASIANDWHYVLFCVSRSAANRALTNMEHLHDIMVGGAGVEQVVIPDIPTAQYTSQDVNEPYVQGPFPCYIPAGSRVTVRSSASATTASDRVVDVILIGFA